MVFSVSHSFLFYFGDSPSVTYMEKDLSAKRVKKDIDDLGTETTITRESIKADKDSKRVLERLGRNFLPDEGMTYVGSFVTHMYISKSETAKTASFIHDSNLHNIKHDEAVGLIRSVANMAFKDLAKHMMSALGLKPPSTNSPRVKDYTKEMIDGADSKLEIPRGV
jgi:hypothetical protein